MMKRVLYLKRASRTAMLVLLMVAGMAKMMAQTPYRQYADDGVLLNFHEIDNVDFRVFLLYNLNQNDQFVLIEDETPGLFSVVSDIEGDNTGFYDAFESFYQNAYADFNLLSKTDIQEFFPSLKNTIPPVYLVSIMMDISMSNSRSTNNHCVDSEPVYTSEFMQFIAASTAQTADQLEGTTIQDGCIGSSYNPSWFHMEISNPGQFIIHMEGHDPNNSSTTRDIDYCIWGPYPDPISPCVAQLTTNKIMDCSYSASFSEDLYLGYPANEHQHQFGHGTVNYHMPESGEYYILMITNYSLQPCIISFSQVGGTGSSGCNGQKAIDAFVNINGGGSVAGAGEYDCGSLCTLTATANEGYVFMDWTDENGVVVSTETQYSFSVYSDKSYTANFIQESNACYLTFDLNDSNGNGWSGNYLVLNFEDGSSQKLTVPYDMSASSYTLPIVDGSHVSLGWISGLYTQQCSFTVNYSNGNTICYAYNLNNDFGFEFDVNCVEMPLTTFVITAMANPIEGGIVSGGGEYGSGTTCTLTATANEGYTFMYWTENGQQVSAEAEYSFIVTSDNTFVAKFCSNDPIVFEDANVKALCVANWDTNGDGELSYAEAAVVTDLGQVFYNNRSITSFNELQYFIGLTSIGSYAFYYCTSLTSIEIPNSVTSIGINAFYCCTSLTSIEIPNSVTSIGSQAFSYCSGMTSIEIPNSVTSIGSSAFSYCSVLTSIEIPNSVTSIGSNVFSGCSGLEQILVAPNNTVYDSRENCNAIIETGTNTLIAGCKNSTIPNSVVSIGSYAFYNCISLTSIEFPNSVTSIGSSAFYGCSGLTSIEIPNSVMLIGSSAFYDCSSLTSIVSLAVIPPANTNVFYNVFIFIPVYVPCGTVEAYQSADGWSGFTNIMGMCSGEVTVIVNPSEGGSVSGAGNYNGGDICVLTATPNSGFSFGNWTENGLLVSRDPVFSFYAHPTTMVANFCSNNPIVFEDANVKALCVANWDANGDGELSYAEAAAVTDLGQVFYNNRSITSFNELQYFIGLTSIGSYAFYHCTSLTSIEIPNSVTSIGSIAFGSSGLTSIEIPNSVTSIGSNAFSYCSGMTMIEIPNSVTSIGSNVFSGCSGLEQILVAPNNTVYDSRENCNAIIETGTNTLIAGCKNSTIPNSVVSIGSYAFNNCSSLTSIEIPNSVTSIGSNAFYGCSGLTSIEIPNSVTSIYNYAFYGCSGLTSITSFAETPPYIDNNTFNNSIPVYVPCGTVEAYQSATVWIGFTNIMGMCPGTISVVASSVEGGTVSGGGSFEGGAMCTLSAMPNEGYLFSHWIKDGNVVSSDAIYDIIVAGDACYVAIFLSLESPVGEGEGTNEYLPSFSYYKYTLSQQIYTSDEIGGEKSIGSISFFNAGETKTRSYDIYLVHTDKMAFESNTDWIAVTENDRVYSGSVTMNSGCWTAIAFDTPFEYDGTSNLVVVIDDNSGNWTNGPHMACRVYSADGNQAIRVYSDNTNYDPFNPSSYNGTLYSEKNQIMLGTLEYNTNIIASANPTEAGTVTGTGFYYVGAVCTLTATANPGYYFLNWTENGNVVSTDADYSFMVIGERNLAANYFMNHWTAESYSNSMFMIGFVTIDGVEQASHTLELGAFCNGECRGSEISFEEDGRWLYFMAIGGNNGDEITFRLYDHALQQELDLYCYNVLPFEGSAFIGLDNPYEVQFVTPYTISAEVDPVDGGTVTGVGKYPPEMSATLVAAPNEGYAFNCWTLDGEVVSTEPSYTFTVTESMNFTAHFDVLQLQQLTAGWNWFSTYLEITLDDLKTALLAAFPNASTNSLVIKSKSNGQTAWNNAAKIWIGSLNTMDLSQMYKVKVPADAVITLKGVHINPADHPVTIENGNNWIAFPFSESRTVNNAFDGFAVNGDMVKSNVEGSAAFYGFMWVGGLKNLKPGQGYIYKSNAQENRTFIYGRNYGK